DEPIAHDVRDRLRLIEARAVGGAQEDGLPVDALRPGRLVGKQQHAALAGGLSQAVPARIGAIELEALNRMTEIVSDGVAQAKRLIGADGDAAKRHGVSRRYN